MTSTTELNELTIGSDGSIAELVMKKPEKIKTGGGDMMCGWLEYSTEGDRSMPIFDLPEMEFFDGVVLPQEGKSKDPSMKLVFRKGNDEHEQAEKVLLAAWASCVNCVIKHKALFGVRVDASNPSGTGFPCPIYRPFDKDTLDELPDASHSMYCKFGQRKESPTFTLLCGGNIPYKELVGKTVKGYPTIKLQGVCKVQNKLYMQVKLVGFLVTDITDNVMNERVIAKRKKLQSQDPDKAEALKVKLMSTMDALSEYPSETKSQSSDEQTENVFN